MKNNTNQIMKLNIPIWIKYWLSKHKNASYILSEILTGTEFYLQDSAPKKFKKFSPIGRTTQESTTGKQLLNSNTPTTTRGGVTLYNNGDGSYTLNGTFTGNTTFQLTTSPIILQNGKTYTQSIKVISGTFRGRVVPSFKNSNDEIQYNYFMDNSTTTTTDTMTLNAYDYYISNGTTVNCTFKVQLEEGTVATAYEPYTGGEPAPNPNYPIEIKNTGDNGSVNEKVSNSDGTQEQNISFPLAQGQKLMEGDYLADDGVHHKMKEIDLSTLTWLQYVTNRYQSDDLNNIIKKPASSAIKAFALATKYNIVPYSNSFVNGNMGVSYNGRISVYDNTGTPSGIFQYELEEEVIDPYTEEQQQYYDEHIKPLRTYKNVTHITSSDETPANLRIQYYKEG